MATHSKYVRDTNNNNKIFKLCKPHTQTADFVLLLIVDIASNANCVKAFIFIEPHMRTRTKSKQYHI